MKCWPCRVRMRCGVHRGHFPHQADVDDLRGLVLPGAVELHFLGFEQLAVFAAETHGAAARRVDQVDDLLVDLAGQDHLHHVHGALVGDPEAVHEPGGDVHLGQHLADLGPAAVHHHRVDAQVLEERDVLGEGGLQLRLLLGGAAVLDHQGLPLKGAHVGQGFQQDLRPC